MYRKLTIASIGLGCIAALTACGPARGGAASAEQPAKTSSVRDSPVISQPERANGYPEAQVRGALTLRSGCLFIGNDLVFWPHGASWDDSAQAVVFQAPPFEDAPPVQLGADFAGGGGYYDGDSDFSWIGEEFGASIERCRATTNTHDVVYAYPSMTP